MRTFQQISPLRTYLRGIRQEGKTIGFVPTMGALHEGHLALIRRAKADCDLVVASIFVNPKQFGPNEDFAAYPRDLNRDLQLASEAGTDAMFAPAVEEMYPSGFQTVIDVPVVGALLEGARRPGHFQGVSTVVAKLLNIVHPDIAFFGQKDYQQLLVIERLVSDLNIAVGITMVPTVREPDGLAMSSRNAYLSPEDRKAATVIYSALLHAQNRVAAGELDAERLQQELEELVQNEPRAALDYVALVHPQTLQPMPSLADAVTLVALAARFGATRLIDNHLVAPEGVPLPKNRFHKS
jgi:pantoate--beta-alanine ligase